MKIYKEITEATEFNFWSGARDTIAELTEDQLSTVWTALEETACEPMTETEVNDFFWFDRDTIAWWLGYKDWDDFMESKEEE